MVKGRFKSFLDLIFYGNVFISLATPALAAQTYWMIGEKPNPILLIFLFFSTLFIYNLQRIAMAKGVDIIHSHRMLWIASHKKLLYSFIIISIAFMAFLIFFIPIKMLITLVFMLLFSISYFLPGLRLRSLGWLKPILIALVWSVTTAYLPIINSGTKQQFIWIFINRFLFIYILAVAFDIKDINVDKTSGIKTMPILLGIRYTKIFLSVLLLSLFIGYAGIMIYGLALPFTFIALSASVLATFYFILSISDTKGDYYYLFAIDGMMLLQPLLVFICHKACEGVLGN